MTATRSLSLIPGVGHVIVHIRLMFSYDSPHRIEPFYRFQVTESHFILLFTIRYLFDSQSLFTTNHALLPGYNGCTRRLWTVS